jgi:hypothetical protein
MKGNRLLEVKVSRFGMMERYDSMLMQDNGHNGKMGYRPRVLYRGAMADVWQKQYC